MTYTHYSLGLKSKQNLVIVILQDQPLLLYLYITLVFVIYIFFFYLKDYIIYKLRFHASPVEIRKSVKQLNQKL